MHIPRTQLARAWSLPLDQILLLTLVPTALLAVVIFLMPTKRSFEIASGASLLLVLVVPGSFFLIWPENSLGAGIASLVVWVVGGGVVALAIFFKAIDLAASRFDHLSEPAPTDDKR